MNAIPKEELESKIIEAVLDFYRSYLAKDGRRKLAEAVKAQIGSETEDLAAARQRAEEELQGIEPIIDNLLDNITETNREYVDKRLNELKTQRQQLEARLKALDRLLLSQAEIGTIVANAMQFLGGLEFALHKGLPEEKLTALWQCIENICINKAAGHLKLAIRLIPAANLPATHECKIPFQV